jgi:hypothetical protein
VPHSHRELIELVSISLEVLAFFFVTVDLYGESRLDQLTVRLSSAMESSSVNIRRYIWDPFQTAYSEVSGAFGGKSEAPAEPIFAFIAIALSLLFYIAFTFLFATVRNIDYHPTGSFGYVTGFLAIVGLVVCGGLAIGYGVMALLILLRGALLFGLFSIKRMKFQGILITVGTILFVVSKGIVWWHSFQGLRHGGL